MTTSTAATANGKTKYIVRSLYRALFRAAAPFQDTTVLNCLLHRSGYWQPQQPRNDDGDDDITAASVDQERSYCYHCLNRVMEGTPRPRTSLDWYGGGSSISPKRFPRQYRFPVHVKETPSLKSVIREEFKCNVFPVPISDEERQRVAFWALRQLTEKLNWYDALQQTLEQKRKNGETTEFSHLNVAPLDFNDPSEYLQPGTFLIAHPNMDGFFARTVICILDHHTPQATSSPLATTTKDEKETEDTAETTTAETTDNAPSYVTYGLIVNRWATFNTMEKEYITLKHTFRNLPDILLHVLGDCHIRVGGPVIGSFQMIHTLSPSNNEYSTLVEKLGGIPIPQSKKPLTTAATTTTTTTPVNSEEVHQEPALFYKSNVGAVAKAVKEGDLGLDQVFLFVGASTWSRDQLQNEVERGTWLPCRLSSADHNNNTMLAARPPANPEDMPQEALLMWRNMLASCGPEEAQLALLFSQDWERHEYDGPCDEKQDDEWYEEE